jgi:hypothetical protein
MKRIGAPRRNQIRGMMIESDDEEALAKPPPDAALAPQAPPTTTGALLAGVGMTVVLWAAVLAVVMMVVMHPNVTVAVTTPTREEVHFLRFVRGVCMLAVPTNAAPAGAGSDDAFMHAWLDAPCVVVSTPRVRWAPPAAAGGVYMFDVAEAACAAKAAYVAPLEYVPKGRAPTVWLPVGA